LDARHASLRRHATVAGGWLTDPDRSSDALAERMRLRRLWIRLSGGLRRTMQNHRAAKVRGSSLHLADPARSFGDPNSGLQVEKIMLEGASFVLCFVGLALFLAALVNGLAIPKMTSPRLGLSAHLTGLQSHLSDCRWSHVGSHPNLAILERASGVWSCSDARAHLVFVAAGSSVRRGSGLADRRTRRDDDTGAATHCDRPAGDRLTRPARGRRCRAGDNDRR
jgi:hypothetical protein